MKWYWIVLIVIVAIAIGFIVAKAIKPKTSALAPVKPVVKPAPSTAVEVGTVTDAAGKKTVALVGR